MQGLKQGLQPYLVGPWCEVFVDPCVWACGPSLPLSAFTAKTARLRLVHLLMQRADPSCIPSSGVKPAAWRDGAQSGVALGATHGCSLCASGIRVWSTCFRACELAQERVAFAEEPVLHQLVERQHPRVRAQVDYRHNLLAQCSTVRTVTVEGLARGKLRSTEAAPRLPVCCGILGAKCC